MRALGIIALCVVGLIGAIYVTYKSAFPSYTYRYRMTVEVMVDGTVRSGASVIAVRIDKQPKFGQAPPQVSRFYGEAVFVDLGNGRNVIALLAAGPKAEDVNYPYNVVPTMFGLTFDDRDLVKLAGLQGSRELPANYLPTFVTFTDLNDPKSARVIAPGDYEQVFGPDVHFKRVWVEMTTASMTRGIDKKIPAILDKLREEAKKSHPRWVGSPYSAALGQFSVFLRKPDMTISSDLFQAILAMDSYNRGYDEGLVVSGNSIGTVTLGLQSDTNLNSPDRNASFFAQSYVVNQGGIDGFAVGQKVISFRGTDDFALDPLHGWPTGIGVFINAQAKLAAQFFQQVVGWV